MRADVESGKGGDDGREGSLVLHHPERGVRNEQREHPGGDREGGEADQGLGPSRLPAPDEVENRKRERADGHRPQLHVNGGDARNGLPDACDEALAGVGREPQDIVQLACDQKNADSRAVADHNRAGNELGNLPEVQKPRQQLDQPDQKGEVDGQLQRRQARRVCVGRDRRGDNQANGARRTEDVVAGGEEERADEAADDHRGDDRGRREVEDEGKTDRLRDRDESQGRPCDRVRTQFRQGIGPQLVNERQADLEHVRAERSDLARQLVQLG